MKCFITFNEPLCFIGLGYCGTIHAPGLNCSSREAFAAAHHVLMAHGLAVKTLRKYGRQELQIGYAPTGRFTYPKTHSKEDIQAAKDMMFHEIAVKEWEWSVTWWSDPVFLGKYPEDALEAYKGIVPDFPAEDMEMICQPLDFAGQNIYDGRMVEMGKDGKPVFSPEPLGFAHTHMKSPVTPEILYWMPQFLYERYGKPVVITENGISNGDLISLDGKIHDGCRIAYLERYLQKLGEAAELVPIMGYFHWSLMDNFEWACGYQERFGLVYVDYQTQERIMKDSGCWYADVIRTNGECLF